MRVTVDVELQDSELGQVAHVREALKSFHSVEMRLLTNKDAFVTRLKEAMNSQTYDQVTDDLMERFNIDLLVNETLDILCDVVLFSAERVKRSSSVEPFVLFLTKLPEQLREKIKEEIVQRAIRFLSMPRRLDCDRMPILPFADTIAAMAKLKLLSTRSVVFAVLHMIHDDTTRSAGVTCLGKLVELAYDTFRLFSAQDLDSIRSTLAAVQQDDTFFYDVEYIIDAFGWSQNRPMLSFVNSLKHHSSPIFALAYHPSGPNARESVVTSSRDGSIATWNSCGVLTESIMLSRHYASSLDLANHGHTLIVGTVGRNSSTPPAVVLYNADSRSREARWEESGAVEPKNARFISCVKSVRAANVLRFCVAANFGATNGMVLYDRTQPVHEFYDHTDLITAMHVPTDREYTALTGSRDCSLLLYDFRSRQCVTSVRHHTNTISAIATYGDLIFTGGLDRRFIVEDFRMLGRQPLVREMESAILSLSVNSSMQCAVSTLTGVYVIPSCSSTSMQISSRASNGPSTSRYNAIAWNSAGDVLYCGGDNAALDLFTRTFPDSDQYEST